ncbi:hypothetical protein LOZ53_002498 [Ophidiomyces ophidiicola]|nr:hypothetical protein LOZ55_003822 [Ophidiomyces ophidiicola]KAI1990376.1 hypothetical protein LOZ54_002477 [Ophidiomyces ophidiicola]KAI1992440.1 hypothetical protein LOZ53_002498 [Ophidiomyces ophidiicola]KAI1998452.1 hypothetical protein LOZ51_002183 [Ophidiomyces ophidiicola]
MQLSRALILAALTAGSTAHFVLKDPPPRGFSEDQLVNFPCGGQAPSRQRYDVSLVRPTVNIALQMGHDQSAVQVLMALGTDPGSNFNITLKPTFRQVGLGDFCIPGISLDRDVLGVDPIENMNATIQVVTNGDPKGGLYNCADIVFSSRANLPDAGKCKNGTGVSAQLFSGAAAQRNANVSTPNGQAQSGGGSSSSGTSSGAPRPTSSSSAASLDTAAWGVMGAVVAGGLALL